MLAVEPETVFLPPDGKSGGDGMAGLMRGLGNVPFAVLLALLLVLGLAVFGPGQGTLPPLDRDEAGFAQGSRQMLESGDFIDIRLQDQPRYEKPVGIYWLQALSAQVFGGADAPIDAFRLPSWGGAALAVMLTAWALLPLIGRQAAVLAALMTGAVLLLHVEARIARIDAVLLACLLLAQGALARLWLAERSGVPTALVFWFATAFGVLLKGPAIALPLIGALGWAMVAERRLPTRARLRPLLGLGVLLLVLAPWLVAISTVAGGAFWQGFIGGEVMGKLAPGSLEHRAPPGTYLSLFFVTFWPFAVLAPAAAAVLWPRRAEPAVGFLLGWVLPSWLFLELVPTKLPHHVLLTYPAIAGLIALSLDAVIARPRPQAMLRALAVAAFVLPALALVLAGVLAPVLIEGRFVPGAAILALTGGAALALGARALWRWRLPAFTGFAGVGAVLAYAGLLHFALPTLDTAFIAPRLATALAQHRCGAEGPVALTTFREPSAIFTLGTDTMLTDGIGAGEALLAGEVPLAFVSDREMAEFAAVAGSRAVALARIDGFNYAAGREAHLTLYALDRPSAAPCDP